MRIRSQLFAFCVTTALAACSVAPATFTLGDGPLAEDCTAAGDEDGNGLGDCSDPACTDIPACQPACGNGKIEAGEGCDDGNGVNGDGCDNTCMVTGCGNGVMTAGEACDDGNTISGDGCDNNCTVTACGNGVMTTGEQCDDGNGTNGDACESNCTLPFCGNGIRDGGEQCDDGNGINGDACENNCTLPFCGNGIRDVGEQCDDGNGINGDACENNCTLPFCGNGIPDVGEQCDTAGESTVCDVDCTVPVCGDGHVNPQAGEACDDANMINDDGCDNNCTVTACGNGTVDSSEQCDDFNTRDFDGCSSRCVLEVFEVEPNEDGTPSVSGTFNGNDFASANADANGAFVRSTTILARLIPDGDEDVFAFENLSSNLPVNIHFDLWDPAVGIGVDCFLIDPVLFIRDAAGAVFAANDDLHGLCSSLDISLSPGQRVYAHVVEFGDARSIPEYTIQATYTTP
jgi:cysteine-rich repeat protein